MRTCALFDWFLWQCKQPENRCFINKLQKNVMCRDVCVCVHRDHLDGNREAGGERAAKAAKSIHKKQSSDTL